MLQYFELLTKLILLIGKTTAIYTKIGEGGESFMIGQRETTTSNAKGVAGAKS